jgi:hypothetical protein
LACIHLGLSVPSTQHDVLHASVHTPLRYVAFIALVIWKEAQCCVL